MFITLEGPEGAGKSTVIRGLADRLSQRREVVQTREPGAGEFGGRIRQMLLEEDHLSATEELFLFLADRAHHCRTIIRPALERNAIVLCDRHAESTLAYQGYGRGLDLDFVRRANLIATDGLRPDLILLFDLPVEAGLARLTRKDRLDREPVEFHQRIRNGFLAESQREPWRWITIDAAQDPEQVLEDAWAAIQSRIEP